eukprot:TRINITY_DN6136_c0_g3_i1.p1 TRINITY_DN6136_c0_g3~~TRINITY_DN6136_c0_g3_i1.p1  ORF type:complete len:336 (-),score=48.35 TRINITY_DN6136_c0_g3_i1:140-1078(-)
MVLWLGVLAFAFFGNVCVDGLASVGAGDVHEGRRADLGTGALAEAVSLQREHHRAHRKQEPGASADAPVAPGARLLLNNLGNQGPQRDTGFSAMVIGNIGQLSNGASSTLVWANNTEYIPATVDSNGLFADKYPAVNVQCDTNVSIRGVFIDNSTKMPISLDRFHLSFLMLDMNTDGTNIQQVIAYNHATYSVSGNTSLLVRNFNNGDVEFTGTTQAAVHGAPTNPWSLGKGEEAGTVTLTWKNVNEISVCLLVHGCATGPVSGRTFKMAGLTSVVPHMDDLRGPNGMQSLKSEAGGGASTAWWSRLRQYSR